MMEVQLRFVDTDDNVCPDRIWAKLPQDEREEIRAIFSEILVKVIEQDRAIEDNHEE